MGWGDQPIGNLKGPKGDRGPSGADLEHAVGDVVSNVTGRNPSEDYGGTWVALPSLGSYKWKRTA